MFSFFLYIVFPSLQIASSISTREYFSIPDGFVEADIKEKLIVESFEYGKTQLQKFLDDFKGPHPIVMIHAWKKVDNNSSFISCEVLRMKLRYLITVHIPSNNKPEEKYIHSVQILNSETDAGARWSHPDESTIEIAMISVRGKYGNNVRLRNVAVFKTVMSRDTHAQMVIDAETDTERMLLDIQLYKKFGTNNFIVSSVDRVY
ncbi:hypothetical protein GPJ56_004939 [Histomonas meleagridis]|uniref:uncharacterized protein n=1 Tax=Histomonas meleagridis TaxID=135588 RepID=UPI00355A54C1|nr:hypothetical protein GPJ56_004939 [Histomonas meleagridis]KAH0798535.1 hypothetical protein GO595_008400 [Histomonas meleagridis]